MTIQENNLVPHSDIHIIRLNTNENVLLLLTPDASDGDLSQHSEAVSSSRRVQRGESSLRVQLIQAEPVTKNANPIMNHHY